MEVYVLKKENFLGDFDIELFSTLEKARNRLKEIYDTFKDADYITETNINLKENRLGLYGWASWFDCNFNENGTSLYIVKEKIN